MGNHVDQNSWMPASQITCCRVVQTNCVANMSIESGSDVLGSVGWGRRNFLISIGLRWITRHRETHDKIEPCVEWANADVNMCSVSPPIESQTLRRCSLQIQSINHHVQRLKFSGFHFLHRLQNSTSLTDELPTRLRSWNFQLSHVSSSVSPSSGVVVNCRVGSWTHKKKQKRKKFFVLEKCWWSLDHDDHDDDILFAVLFMLHRVINTSSQIWGSHG